jgi:hypothetical protein
MESDASLRQAIVLSTHRVEIVGPPRIGGVAVHFLT